MYPGVRQYCWKTRTVTSHSWAVKGMANSECVPSFSSLDWEPISDFMRASSFWTSFASLLVFQTSCQSFVDFPEAPAPTIVNTADVSDDHRVRKMCRAYCTRRDCHRRHTYLLHLTRNSLAVSQSSFQ